MELYIGGYAQGKLHYVLKKYAEYKFYVLDGKDVVILPIDLAKKNSEEKSRVIFNHFNLWIREVLIGGMNAEIEVMRFLKDNPNSIIICDEVGNGIVPLEPFEREYREQLGRILIQLATKAERVGRILCGLEQRLK